MKKNIYIVVLTILSSLPTTLALAQTAGNGGSVTIPNPLGEVTITGLFTTLLQILLVFAVPIVVFFIIYAGFLYVTAQGKPDQISQAHHALLYALIGGVLILGGTLLIEVVQSTVDAVRTE